MKKLNSFKRLGMALALTLFTISCEKSEVNSEIINEDNQEEFMSTTGNSDSIIFEKNTSKITKPILHMHFDASLNKEEVSTEFNKVVNEQFGKGSALRSTEWNYQIYTYTGTQTNNSTDGDVYVFAGFNTDTGTFSTTVELDNAGDDREGGWDVYLFTTNIDEGLAVNWVEATAATIALKGTDGWFLKRFYVTIRTWKQSVGSTGSSTVASVPEIWLDNPNSNEWDYYLTGNIGHGRLNF